jgi:hypothetical protein
MLSKPALDVFTSLALRQDINPALLREVFPQ